jgi:hypothetical protein
VLSQRWAFPLIHNTAITFSEFVHHVTVRNLANCEDFLEGKRVINFKGKTVRQFEGFFQKRKQRTNFKGKTVRQFEGFF